MKAAHLVTHIARLERANADLRIERDAAVQIAMRLRRRLVSLLDRERLAMEEDIEAIHRLRAV